MNGRAGARKGWYPYVHWNPQGRGGCGAGGQTVSQLSLEVGGSGVGCQDCQWAGGNGRFFAVFFLPFFSSILVTGDICRLFFCRFFQDRNVCRFLCLPFFLKVDFLPFFFLPFFCQISNFAVFFLCYISNVLIKSYIYPFQTKNLQTRNKF